VPGVHGHGQGCVVTPAAMAALPVVRDFLGERDQVARAREFVGRVLGGYPAADDAVLLTSEVVTNAVLHTASGDGGFFRVIVLMAGELVRVEVHDGGSETAPNARALETPGECGAGLYLVETIAARWGHDGGPHGRVVWFEVERQ
jgi:anti-sigma regulatory factor (Ser/Thr protein kinase)